MRPPLPAGPWLVVGLARSGLAAGRLLAERGERVVGVDAREPEPGGDPGFETILGTDGLRELDAAAAVVKSPGVPPRAPVVAEAVRRGIPVLGELELAWRLMDEQRFVGVTGTNGKTTTTAWIAHVLALAGVPHAAAGNVGTPLSSLVGALEPGAWVVCECSSYQLHDAPAYAPEVGVLLNLESDHLDWHGSVGAYHAAKLSMFARQGPDATAIAPPGIHLPGDARRVPLGAENPAAVGLPGAHNLVNAAAVALACRALGVAPGVVAEGLRTFPGVLHRLEVVAEHDGVRYVNDSKATNVASALVAIDAAGDRPVHWILGGDDAKGEDLSPLRDPAARCAGVYLIGEAEGRLLEALGRGIPCGTLERAVAEARMLARPGDVVLLSPACASWDQFANFEARGARFRELVAGG